jgi:hypothetical protein
MDSIAHRYGLHSHLTKEHFLGDLELMKAVCHWTEGYWDFGPGRQKRWDELQNTTRDIEALTQYLCANYKRLVVEPQRAAQRKARGDEDRVGRSWEP